MARCRYGHAHLPNFLRCRGRHESFTAHIDCVRKGIIALLLQLVAHRKLYAELAAIW
jgi:hypothetical protein